MRSLLAALLPECGLPITPVKMLEIYGAQIHSLNTTQVHVDFVGIGARDIKRRYPASGAEMVFGDVCIEGVSGEFLPRRQQAETLARDYPVHIAFFGADGAIALRNPSVYRSCNFVNHAPAMAPAPVNRGTSEFVRHEYEFGAK